MEGDFENDSMAYGKPDKRYQRLARSGKSAITFFVKAEAKPNIRAALADAGYGCSYQEGLKNLLKELLESQGRSTRI